MGMEAKYVANTLTVPQQRSDYAMDLNGDGRVDNQLGNIIGALTGAGLNTQDGVDKAIAAGEVILLVDQTGADLTNDPCSAAKVSVGKQQTMPVPKFDGSDSFTIDTSVGGGSLFGKITSSAFNSNNPATATTNYQISIQLPLVSGAAAVQLNISGAHIQFTKSGDGLMKGQINGAIKNSDVQGNIIPNVASLLSMRLTTDPNSSTTMQIKQLFDVGDGNGGSCTNTDGSMSAPNDNKIGTCEVAGNSIIKNVLAPDVQMFDSSGNYKPNKDNTMKDSLSLGLSFTAVKATF
jgi:hypothetical protein